MRAAEAGNRRDRLREMLADLKMPGALEAVDGILAQADGGAVSAAEAIEQLLDAQIGLRNNRRLQAAMRSSRLSAVKTLAQFDFAFQFRAEGLGSDRNSRGCAAHGITLVDGSGSYMDEAATSLGAWMDHSVFLVYSDRITSAGVDSHGL